MYETKRRLQIYHYRKEKKCDRRVMSKEFVGPSSDTIRIAVDEQIKVVKTLLTKYTKINLDETSMI